MAIAFVQQVGGASSVNAQTSFTTTAVTFTAGNLLVALATWSYSGVGATVTITNPGAWTDSGLGTKNNGAPNNGAITSFIPNNAGGSQSWTWNVTANGGGTLIGWAYEIYEFSGVALASPLDLAAVNNATGASSSTSLDSTAASGTTQSGDLLLELVSVARSSAGTLSTDTTNSVPTAGWTVDTQFNGTGTGVQAHASGQHNILSGTQANPRGVLTSTISESSTSWLLTFKPPSAGVFPSYAIVRRKPRLFVMRSRVLVAPQTPTVPATTARKAIQKPPLRKRQSIAVVAPQTPTFPSTSVKVVQKRKVKPVPPKALAAPPTPTAPSTSQKAIQKPPLRKRQSQAVAAPQTPTFPATTAQVAIQKRKIKPVPPRSLAIPPPPPPPSTSVKAAQKRPQRAPKPQSVVAPQTPTVAATANVGLQKRKVKAPPPKTLVAPFNVVVNPPATSVQVVQKRKVKPVPPKTLVAPQTPTVPATQAVARQKPRLKPLRPGQPKFLVATSPALATQGCVTLYDSVVTNLAIADAATGAVVLGDSITGSVVVQDDLV